MSESGYKVIRWREAPEKLLGQAGNSIATFVVVGPTKMPFSDEQMKALQEWVCARRVFCSYRANRIHAWRCSRRLGHQLENNRFSHPRHRSR